jgi:hypothetical protein
MGYLTLLESFWTRFAISFKEEVCINTHFEGFADALTEHTEVSGRLRAAHMPPVRQPCIHELAWKKIVK